MVNYTQSWKFLKDCVSKIQDPTLRNVIMAEFRKRAKQDWGFNPDSKYGVAKNESVQLDDWEKEFVSDIEKAIKYEIDTREEKRKKTAKEAHARMMQFIELGGTLADIPDDVRSDTVDKLYHDCLMEYGDNLLAEADRFIGVQQ
jgi:hypothetical protein